MDLKLSREQKHDENINQKELIPLLRILNYPGNKIHGENIPQHGS